MTLCLKAVGNLFSVFLSKKCSLSALPCNAKDFTKPERKSKDAANFSVDKFSFYLRTKFCMVNISPSNRSFVKCLYKFSLSSWDSRYRVGIKDYDET